MTQLTIRGFDPELEHCLKQLAKREGLSLNQAALRLLRLGAGLERDQIERCIGDDLNQFCGVWSEQEAQQFEDATRGFSAIDPELWT